MRKGSIRAAVLAGAAMVSMASVSNAVIIYQDSFDGTGGVVSGRTPDVVSGTFGGSSGVTWTSDATATTDPDAVWTATGGVNTPAPDTTAATLGTFATGADANLITNAFLPFIPQAGVVYDFHLDVDSSATGASGNWLGMAFTQAGLNGHTAGGASSALSNDNPYGLILLKGSGVVQDFGGLGTANGSTGATVTAGVYNAVDIILDTTGAQWKISWLVNNTSAGSFTYTTNPTIGDVVFGSNKLTGQVANFSLTTLPEPGSAAVLGLGSLALLRRRSARK